MDNHIEIRRYNHNDYNALKHMMLYFESEVEFGRPLNKSEFNKVYSTIDSVLSDIEIKKDNCVLAYYKNTLLGFNMFHLYNNKACEEIIPGTVELTKFFVDKRIRRKGIGYALDISAIRMIKYMEKKGADIKKDYNKHRKQSF